MEQPNSHKCVICEEMVTGVDASRQVRESSLQVLTNSSKKRGDFVADRISRLNVEDVKFHSSCRKNYTDKRRISQVSSEGESSVRRKLRTDRPHFDWRVNCFLCGEIAEVDDRHPDRNEVHEIRTTEPTKSRLLRICETDQQWSEDVKTRLDDCIDLVAVEARYHHACYRFFCRNDPSGTERVGRPTDNSKVSHFNTLCKWLEEDGDADLYSLDELWSKMYELAGAETSDEIWSKKWLRTKLMERYEEHIFFADVGGSRKDVVCFRNMASYIVNERWYSERSQDEQTEKNRVLKAAARICREDIRAANYDKSTYPRDDDLSDIQKMKEFVVPSLATFLDTLLQNDLWKVSLGQALTQAARPRSVIAPILFGVGVDIDHVLGSPWAVRQLSRLGFSITPDEVSLYKNCIMQDEEQYSLSMGVQTVQDHQSVEPIQFAGDNADANIATVVGNGTFHGTGVISWSRKCPTVSGHKPAVVRRARMKTSDLRLGQGIREVAYIRRGKSALSSMKFVPLTSLFRPYVVNAAEYYSTLLWRSARFLSHRLEPSPDWTNWSGYIQSVFWKDGENTSVDDVHILPLIDLNPNDVNTLHSVLCFVEDQIKAAGVPCTTITFDQPLYLKAVEIQTSTGRTTLVIRLGGFHTLMNAVGATFYVMRDSGVEDAMMEVYGANTVQHIMSGKAIARALRALHLVDAALHTKLLECLRQDGPDGYTDDEDGNRLTEDDLINLNQLLTDISKHESDLCECVEEDSTLQRLDVLLEQLQKKLRTASRTAKLWLQFLYHISVIKSFIFAERSRNWEEHLLSCSKLLNVFAASGHIHYAKCCRLYLQQMQELPHSHPWLYRMYTEQQMHVVQRTGHALNGLWTDLCIEQILMASMKSSGGLTHGRGLTENVRNTWVYTMHHRAAVHQAMSVLTGNRRVTSEQHVELGRSRRGHDQTDLGKIILWLDEHNPFDPDVVGLRSISSGISAKEGDGINCDAAEEIGYNIQVRFDNQSYEDAKLKRKDRVRTLQDLKPGVKVGEKTIQIDPTTLFMRCVELSKRLGLDSSAFFEYEMSTVPLALFKDTFMYKTEKSTLANKMLSSGHEITEAYEPDDVIIDGGWLLHRVSWKRNVTFSLIFDQYAAYVGRFASKCSVIFDGYEHSIKDHEHTRRCEAKSHCDVHIRPDTTNKYDKSKFLSNTNNKGRIIELLGLRLRRDGHDVVFCTADADITVARTAIELWSRNRNVEVICSDTDVLCILVHHVNNGGVTNEAKIILRRETQTRSSTSGGKYSIRDICRTMHPAQVNAILFLHSWSGCDTTSGFYGRGKLELYNQITKSDEIRCIAKQMYDGMIPQQRIGELGAALVYTQYGGTAEPDLGALRHSKFNEMIAKCARLDPRVLPPTTRAVYFHSLRCHLQIIRWKELDDLALDEKEWGWEVTSEGSLYPIPTDMEVAPENVLNFVRCRCKKLDNKCGNNLCNCKKHGLKCVEACSGCHGRDCLNQRPIVIGNEDSGTDD